MEVRRCQGPVGVTVRLDGLDDANSWLMPRLLEVAVRVLNSFSSSHLHLNLVN
jgi:hypothetical protein